MNHQRLNFRPPAAALAVLLMGVSLSLSQPSGTEPVAASLVPEVLSFEPGKPFWVALSLTLEPGWHIYWKNPGDTGLPTAVQWQLPSGWKAGEIQWPYPDAFEFGGLINLGYEIDAILLVQLTPPPGIEDGAVASLRAKLEWLACKESCVPGEAQLMLDLPSAAGGVRMNSEHHALFAHARSRLPVLSSDWKVRATREKGTLNIHLVRPGWYRGQLTGVRFFPYQSSLIQYAPAQKLEKADDGYVLSAALDPAHKGPLPEIGGVLVSTGGWTRTGASRALEIRTRVRRSECYRRSHPDFLLPRTLLRTRVCPVTTREQKVPRLRILRPLRPGLPFPLRNHRPCFWRWGSHSSAESYSI